MAKLTEAQKLFAVLALARFQSPAEVGESLRAELGVDIPRQQVETYDPTKYAGRRLSKKWRDVFEQARAEYIEDVHSLPLAHRGYRMRELQRLYDRARTSRNVTGAKDLIVEAEKIMGEMYSNRRKFEHTGKNGGPIETRDTTLEQMTTEELVELAAELTAEIAAGVEKLSDEELAAIIQGGD